jgi:hypothetical protein
MTAGALLLQVGALAVSLFGYLLLARDGAFGSGRQIEVGQGVALLSIGIVYGWWLSPMVASMSGIRGAFLALVVLDLLWVIFAQGVAGLVFCAFPVCPDFAPWGDVVRYGSLVLGAAAAWTAWRAYRAVPGPTQWAPAVTALVLVVVSFAIQGANTKIP